MPSPDAGPIAAVHTLIYSDDPAATRRFLREVLRFPFVSDGHGPDAGTDADWLIFGTGPSELGVNPRRASTRAPSTTPRCTTRSRS